MVQFKEINQKQNMTREEEFGKKILCEDAHACKPTCWPSYFHVFSFASPTHACLDARYAIRSISDALVDMLVHVQVHVR